MSWWRSAVFYQVYPRSYADGNGDGIGDFPGLTGRLDHLVELGIDAIWLSPHFPSPFVDCGYDITDYRGVAPEYGTLDDFRAFLAAAHARGLRVVLDLVLNHTSEEHPWFVASRDGGPGGPMRDWYVWRDGRVDETGREGPPNNWLSIFGGPAWTRDAASGQWYYHAFLQQQPDLNWRHPAVRAAMFDAIRFWLDLGADGFRLDAIATIFEHPDLPDHPVALTAAERSDPPTADFARFLRIMTHQFLQPGLHELMKELRALVDGYPGERVLLGEDEDVSFHGSGDDELHLLFNFELVRLQPLTPAGVRANQAARHAALPEGAWPCNTLGNHDGRRLKSRLGDGVHDDALARLHAALLLTLRGTPVLYYGEEIGMSDLVVGSLGQVRDTAALAQYRRLTLQRGIDPEAAFASIRATTRDRCRGPMQWSAAPNAGFCPAGVVPWLPVTGDHDAGVNVAAQRSDDDSMLAYYRRLLALRRRHPALHRGAYRPVETGDARMLAYWRLDDGADAGGGERCLVVLNFGAEPVAVSGTALAGGPVRVLFSSAGPGGRAADPRLGPHEVRILSAGQDAVN